jgi:hypothetical protein
MLTPNVSAPTVHAMLDRVENRVLEVAPNLKEFVPPRLASPWIDDPINNGYWPR